jgi:hypothetical protein
MIERRHSDGSDRDSINERNKRSRGYEIADAVWRKRVEGRLSGPAAELVLSFLRIFSIILGEIVISEILMLSNPNRDGNGGRVPSSVVKTD